jgi:hypothetical protein
VILGFLVVGILLGAVRGLLVSVNELAVGDCLFVRTSTAQEATRPIGDERVVTEAILAGKAERASCSASHGHEVSALVDLATLADPFSEARAACQTAFEPYVRRAAEGSLYLTFAAVPTPGAQAAGETLGVCLVARADGQWMDHPARGSKE